MSQRNEGSNLSLETTSGESLESLSALVQNLRSQDQKIVHVLVANEINNHLYLLANFSNRSRVIAQDIPVLLSRLELALKTALLSQNGPENFRPQARTAGMRAVAEELGRKHPQ